MPSTYPQFRPENADFFIEDSMDVFKKRNQTFPENLQGFCLSQAPYQQAEGE